MKPLHLSASLCLLVGLWAAPSLHAVDEAEIDAGESTEVVDEKLSKAEKKALRDARKAKREELIEQRKRRLAKKDGWEHETITDKTITKDGETIDVDKRNYKQVKRHEDGKSWHRDYERSDSKGNHNKMTADGKHTKNEDGSVDIDITRSGERTRAGKDTVAWHEDVEGTMTDNEYNGKNRETTRNRINSKGRELEEEKQRQTHNGDGVKSFREAAVRTVNGEEKKLYQEGRTIRTELKNGYVLQSITKGKADDGSQWTKERRETIRKLENGERYREVLVAKRNAKGKVSYHQVEGVYSPSQTGKGWDYKGTIKTSDGDEITSESEVAKQFRRLPFKVED